MSECHGRGRCRHPDHGPSGEDGYAPGDFLVVRSNGKTEKVAVVSATHYEPKQPKIVAGDRRVLGKLIRGEPITPQERYRLATLEVDVPAPPRDVVAEIIREHFGS